ncbi:MAG TPA: PqqD family protein [Pyrinomonadaceae bacterium]|nr:PqqD family protein [Pyrinomonadaceae bacterium]
MPISFSDRVRVPDDVLISNLQDESVLLKLENERYFGLDDVGTRILSVLANSDSIDAAYKLLLEEYEVDEVVLRQDLLSLIDQLATQGLIRIEGANDVQPLSEKPKPRED